MNTMSEIVKTARRVATFPSTKLLFSFFRRTTKNFRDRGAQDCIPHQVLSHGFMEWQILLHSKFPGFSWRGEKVEAAEGLSWHTYEKILYERFFLEVAEKVLVGFTKQEKQAIKEAGWKEYLED